MARPIGSKNKGEEQLNPAKALIDSGKVFAKAFHMVVGVDLIGSKSSMSASRNLTLEVTPIGIVAISANSQRKILIPWTNIKGAELFNE